MFVGVKWMDSLGVGDQRGQENYVATLLGKK